MTPGPPSFTVLLLCWNHSAFLEQCIGALAAQTDKAFTIAFLDNASTDGSFDLAGKSFERHGLDAKMLRNEQEQSIPHNLNRLLGESLGELVAILSTDDWYAPDYVAEMRDLARKRREAGWFSCGGWLFFDQEQTSRPVDEASLSTEEPVVDAILAGREPFFFVGCAYLRSSLEAVGGWDEQQLIEDRDLFLRLSDRFDHARTTKRLVHYRRHSMASANNARFMIDGWERFFAKHQALFGDRLLDRRAETYRAYAALLTDQRKFGLALRAIARSLIIRPVNGLGWRTLAYVGRRIVARY